MRTLYTLMVVVLLLAATGCGNAPRRVAGERRSVDLSSFPPDTSVSRLKDGSLLVLVPPSVREVRVVSPEIIGPNGRPLREQSSGGWNWWTEVQPARRSIDLSSFPSDTIVRRMEDGSVMILVPATVREVKTLGADFIGPDGKKVSGADGVLGSPD